MNTFPDNFIEESRKTNTERKAVIAIIQKVRSQYNDPAIAVSNLQLELALNGYTLLPISTGLSPKPEWVVVNSTAEMFEPSYIVSADPTNL